MNDTHRHLSAEALQALLDGDLPAREARRLRAEIDSCPRCHAEFEGWQTLFDDLGELSELRPSIHFQERVLSRVATPKRRPALAGLLGRKSEAAHATGDELLEHLDGRLAPRDSIRIEAHLEECAACRTEMEGYHSVVSRLEQVDRLAPSPGFGEAVMASVRIQQMAAVAMAPTTRSGRLVAWIEGLLPSSSRGWAVALGVGTAPAVIAALVIHTVFSFEQVTLGSLFTFLGFKLSSLTRGMTAWLQGWAGSSPLVSPGLETLRALGGSPALLAATAVLCSATVFGAAWVLYRNLIVPSREEVRHAQVSF